MNAHDTNKSIISRILGGAVAGPVGAIAGDLLFGDSHARENTDPDGIRKKYYDRMFDRLDDLNMALSGQGFPIPADQVVEAMARVGRQLPIELKETAQGGIAATKRGREIAQQILHKERA